MEAEARPGVRVRVRFGAGTERCARGGARAAGWSTGTSSSGSPSPTTAGRWPPSPRSSRPSRCSGRSCSRCAGPSPTGTPDRSPTCCSWPCPSGTSAPSPRPPRRRCPRPGRPSPAAGSYPAGPGFLEALAGGGTPRAVWTALPGPHWPDEWGAAVAATLASGRGALVVVPDGRDRRPGRRGALRAGRRRAGMCCSPRTSGPRSATGGGWRSAAGRCGPSSAPGRPCSRRCVTSAWWDLGRRRRQPRRDARPAAARPRRPAAARRPREDRLPAGRPRPHRGSRPAGGERLGPPLDAPTASRSARRPR